MLFRRNEAGKRIGAMAAEGGLHRIENTLAAGASPKDAKAAVILIHGRGATPESMLPLAEAFGRKDVHYLAPRATQNTWYPNSFLAPIEMNEPWLSSALSLVAALVDRLPLGGIFIRARCYRRICARRVSDQRVPRAERAALRHGGYPDRRDHWPAGHA